MPGRARRLHLFARLQWRRTRAGLAIIFAIIFLVFFSAVVPGLAVGEEYRLGTGDQLRVTVFGQKDLSGQFEVGTTGNITLPLIGEVAVIDQSLQDVQRAIVAKLKPDYLKNPQVSVEVINYRPFYIIGEVKNPGSYPYVGGMRVINAVAMAGGFSYRANESKVLIMRDKGSGNQETATPDTSVLPGDVIEVQERFF